MSNLVSLFVCLPSDKSIFMKLSRLILMNFRWEVSTSYTQKDEKFFSENTSKQTNISIVLKICILNETSPGRTF